MKNKLAFLSILVLAMLLRTGGVYRGLDVRYNYHPDEAKQVVAFSRYLDGDYIWYINSRAYDGYPLFLSHLDEWTLRVARPLQRALHSHLQPDRPLPRHPSRTKLYAWSRTLRVVHGVLAVLFTMLAARKLGFSRRAAHAAGLLIALSPIAAAVTRFSTGEVGTDLFAAATVWLLALHAERPRFRWLLAAGAAVGWGFSSKYNGVLVAIIPIIYLTMRMVAQRGGFRRFAAESASSLAGCVTAIMIAAPQWLWAPARTFSDMIRGFDYVKNYAVSPEILGWPSWKVALLSLRVNTLPLVTHLGWFLIALALAALACALLERLRSLRDRQEDTPANRAAWLRLGLYIFPPVAIFVSLAGKLHIQSIHFSFLLPALSIAAVGGASLLMRQRGRLPRLIGPVLFAAALADLAWSIRRENFFWRRDDIMYGVVQMDQIYRETSPVKSYRRGQPTASTIKAFSLEGRHPSNFRNRPHTVKGADGAWWNEVHIAPVPTVPFLDSFDWIFANGPVFPRNDRRFRVEAGGKAQRHVVLYETPGLITLGLASGRFPACIEIVLGGTRERVTLPPHSRREIVLQPGRWRTMPKARFDTDPVFLVPLAVRPVTGDAWVSVLSDPREIRNARAFSGDTTALRDLATHLPDRGALANAISRIRFLESDPAWEALLAPRSPRKTLDGMPPLPAGRYRLTLDVDAIQADTTIAIELRDREGRLMLADSAARTFQLAGGLQRLEWRFSKRFAPHEVDIRVLRKSGACRISRWTLMPDATAIFDDLAAVAAGGEPPVWAGPPPGGDTPPERFLAAGGRYGHRGAIGLDGLHLPKCIHPGVPFNAMAALSLHGSARWEEQRVDVRLVDEQGRTAMSFRLQVSRARMGNAPGVPESITPYPEIPLGRYTVQARIWNSRTLLRLPLQTTAEGVDRTRQWVHAGTLDVTRATGPKHELSNTNTGHYHDEKRP